MDKTLASPTSILLSIWLEIAPVLFTKRFWDTERTWKQSAQEFFANPFNLSGEILIIQGAIL